MVVDSVAALTPKSELEGDMGDRSVGLQARLMSQAMRKLTGSIARTNTTCIFINQLRAKIGGLSFGPQETTTGGNALKFYASVRIDIRGLGQVKDGEEPIGRHVKTKVVKNKVAPPFKVAEFDILFGEGISHESEVLDLGVDLGIIKKSGSWFSYGDSKLAQGREAAKNVLADNPDLTDEIEAKIMAALNEAGQKPNKKSLKLKSVSSSASDNDDSALAAGGENPLPRIDDDFVMDDDDDFAIEDDVRE